jgi:hypothetical protein
LPQAEVCQNLVAYEKIIHISRSVRSCLRWIVDRLPEVGNDDCDAGDAFDKRAFDKRARAINPVGFYRASRTTFLFEMWKCLFDGQSN